MSIVVVVPWRTGCPHREAAWRWVREQYTITLPGVEIVEAGCPSGPWVKASAVMPALDYFVHDIVVVADADCWAPMLPTAINHIVTGRATWAVPHSGVFRLRPDSTQLVLDGQEPNRMMPTVDPPYRGLIGGGIVVARREVIRDVPLDPRFVGWGGEDESWGRALVTLRGETFKRVSGPLWHLWHPPQERPARHSHGSSHNTKLRNRYVKAMDDPDKMMDLIREA